MIERRPKRRGLSSVDYIEGNQDMAEKMTAPPIEGGADDLKEMIATSGIERMILDLPEDLTIQAVASALSGKGIESTVESERTILVSVPNVGEMSFNPAELRDQEQLGFCEAGNIHTDFLNVDEVENAVDSLETASHLTSRPGNLKWKWIAHALDHSFYSFMIANLTNGNWHNVLEWKKNADDGVMYLQNEKAWISRKVYWRDLYPSLELEKKHQAFNIRWDPIRVEDFPKHTSETRQMKGGSERNPDERGLIGFWTALARVQDGQFYMNRIAFRSPPGLILTDQQRESIVKLHDHVRNEFEHFRPKLWRIELRWVKGLCSDILGPLEVLSLKGQFVVPMNFERYKQRVSEAIETLRGACG